MKLVAYIALRQLWARKLLNGIAVMAVVMGIVTLLATYGILKGFSQKFMGSILQFSPHITLFDKELLSSPPLLASMFQTFVAADVAHQAPSQRQTRIDRPEDILRLVERTPGVAAASGSLVGAAVLALGMREYSVDLRGIDAQRQDRVTPIASHMTEGRYTEFAGSPEGVLLGMGVARRLGAKLGDSLVGASPRGTRLELKVVGIFDANVPPIDGVRVYTSLRTAQVLLGRPDTVSRIEIKLNDPELSPRLTQQLERALRYDGESWQEANANLLSVFRMQNATVGFVVAAILAVGGFAILAIQVMIVLQKVRDIAILRSIGFNRRDIIGVFLTQGLVIGLLGSAIGDVLGHVLLGQLAQWKTPQDALVRADHFLVEDDPVMYVYAVAFALSVGLAASLLPAVRASRIEPVDVLRGQVG